MPLSQCNEIYLDFNKDRNLHPFRDGLSRGQYCVYHPTKGSCALVGGAPPLNFPPNASLPDVIGLISLEVGNKCTDTRPEIFTRVAYYIPWIESHVWPFDRSTLSTINRVIACHFELKHSTSLTTYIVKSFYACLNM